MICVASNGIVIATEKKSSSILIDDSMLEKVAVICPNIGIVYSGMGPDFRILIAKARKSAQAYWKIYGEYPPTRVLTQEIATVMQEATQSGYAFGETLMVTECKVEYLQWRTAVWRFTACSRIRPEPRTDAVPSRSFWLILGLEGKRDREKYDQRKDFPRETVRVLKPFVQMYSSLTFSLKGIMMISA